MTNEIFQGLPIMYMIAVVAMITVMVAIGVDLVFGWHKAKLRNEAHTSYAFSRTLTKFLLYEGVLVMGGCIDTLLHLGLYEFADSVYTVPLAVILLSIILVATEIWSMHEKADQKQRERIDEVARLILNELKKHTRK